MQGKLLENTRKSKPERQTNKKSKNNSAPFFGKHGIPMFFRLWIFQWSKSQKPWPQGLLNTSKTHILMGVFEVDWYLKSHNGQVIHWFPKCLLSRSSWLRNRGTSTRRFLKLRFCCVPQLFLSCVSQTSGNSKVRNWNFHPGTRKKTRRSATWPLVFVVTDAFLERISSFQGTKKKNETIGILLDEEQPIKTWLGHSRSIFKHYEKYIAELQT